MNNLNREFFNDIRMILKQARQKAYYSINTSMVEAYWRIGKRIVEEEQRGEQHAEYGIYLIKNLSLKLMSEFGKGFSEANLKNFRQFYLTFQKSQIRYALRSELTWTHYRLIMRVENWKSREFYLMEAAEQNWSTRQLERNINTFYYERLLSSKNKKLILGHESQMEKMTSTDFIKDPFVFEFLGRPDQITSESILEEALLSNLQKFILELGKGFAFVAHQQRITTETSHFFVDLVFYNYILNCFVLIDLKLGKLTHQDVGQMDMYVRMYEQLVKPKKDNPTIGIILCSEKDETVVQYSVLNENKQLFASKYMMYLPTEEELRIELEREKKFILDGMARKKELD
jgi:predicted nuclease of restriction endonuclease-like (RecB) superfamily